MDISHTSFFGTDDSDEVLPVDDKAVLYDKDLIQDLAEFDSPTVDRKAKWILRHRSVLARILQFGVPEFKDMPFDSIKELIPAEAIVNDAVGTSTDSDFVTTLSGDLISLDEKPIMLDILFRDAKFNMMIDIEPQKVANPGYSLVKRGEYYLSRMLSDQLKSDGATDYDALRKCYSIWLCFDTLFADGDQRVPGEYRFKMMCTSYANKSLADEYAKQADLMELVIVRSGGTAVKRNTLQDLVNVLFRDADGLDNYFCGESDSSSVKKGVHEMSVIVEAALNHGKAEGIAEGIAEGEAKGIAKGKAEGKAEGIIRLGYSLGISSSDIIEKLMEICNLSEKEAIAVLKQYPRNPLDQV